LGLNTKKAAEQRAAADRRRGILSADGLARPLGRPEESAMPVMLRRVGVAVLSVAMVVVLWLAGVWAMAYSKAPRLVEELEKSGALAFDPAVLPAARVCALLAVQDRTFFRHHGIALLDGPPLHTTMTQGICKGLFFRGFSPGLLRYRKIMLMVDALAVDHRISKEMQLRIFMNRASFGRAGGAEVLGFKAAARAYFGRDVLQLNDQEYLALVAMLLAPGTYNVAQKPEANAARVRLLKDAVDAACPADCIEKPPHEPCGRPSDDRSGPSR
jgi:monofunctional glycosyltransferase